MTQKLDIFIQSKTLITSKEKREGRYLNLAHYKISLSAKLGITRQQPPSLFSSFSFSIAQPLQHLLALTLPLGMEVVVPFPFQQKV